MRRGRWWRRLGLVFWFGHFVVAALGVYRCGRCKGALNYRWWCKRCQRYRLPAK